LARSDGTNVTDQSAPTARRRALLRPSGVAGHGSETPRLRPGMSETLGTCHCGVGRVRRRWSAYQRLSTRESAPSGCPVAVSGLNISSRQAVVGDGGCEQRPSETYQVSLGPST